MHYVRHITTILDNSAIRRYVFWGLVSVCTLSVLLYMLFVASIAFYAGEHKHFSYTLARTQTEVSTLESRYIELTEEVDISYAYQNGYVDVGEVTYVRRGALVRNDTAQNGI